MGVTMMWEQYGYMLVVASVIGAEKPQTVPAAQ
jgi:hypothetical protein